MTTADIAKNVLTFGAHSRVQPHLEAYRNRHAEVDSLRVSVESNRLRVNKKLADLIGQKRAAVDDLKRLSLITASIRARERELVREALEEEGFDVKRIEGTVSAAESAASAAKGAAAGISTAWGAWALVGTYGAASTGTAITSLSGAAATNATLAWFGGGSLASGGGGVAAGSLVLGAALAVPALVITAAFLHLGASKKIKKIKAGLLELDRFEGILRRQALAIEATDRRAIELSDALAKAVVAYRAEFDRVYAVLFPHGWLSRVWRRIKGWFKAQRPSEAELEAIACVGRVAVELAKLIDQPVFQPNGSLS